MRRAKARYVVGLTARSTAKDGQQPIIQMQCCPIRFNMSAKAMTETTPFEDKAMRRFTEFQISPGRLHDSGDPRCAGRRRQRNEVIVSDVVRARSVQTLSATLGRTDRELFQADTAKAGNSDRDPGQFRALGTSSVLIQAGRLSKPEQSATDW